MNVVKTLDSEVSRFIQFQPSPLETLLPFTIINEVKHLSELSFAMVVTRNLIRRRRSRDHSIIESTFHHRSTSILHDGEGEQVDGRLMLISKCLECDFSHRLVDLDEVSSVTHREFLFVLILHEPEGFGILNDLVEEVEAKGMRRRRVDDGNRRGGTEFRATESFVFVSTPVLPLTRPSRRQRRAIQLLRGY